VLAVGMDPAHVGQLMTLNGTSLGMRRAFEGLLRPYMRKLKMEMPVCELASQARNDDNNTYAPILTPVSWVPRDKFPGLVSPEPEPVLLTAPPTDVAPPTDDELREALRREIGDDDVPF